MVSSGSKSAKKPIKSKAKTPGKKITKSIEDTYQKKDLHEHILSRPDTYVGSVTKDKQEMWIYNENRKANEPQFIRKVISHIPALYKIFDEILVNARDHQVNCDEKKLERCTTIKVTIDQESNRISVWNNGQGIPVEIHKEHNQYVPSMIFGELLTGSNYDDEEERKTGGRNGLGSKLTNIFSSEFIVETLDSKTDKKFYQKFTDNMYTKGKPKVTSGGGKKSYTQISFVPDLAKFKIDKLSDDIVALFKKRVYDIAMTCTNVKVYYNGDLIKTNDITKYISMFFPDGTEIQKFLDVKSHADWKVAVVYDPTGKYDHQVISFVNGIHTRRGGTHCTHVIDKIVKQIQEKVTSKLKKNVKVNIKPSMIKENLIFFIDCCIVNPSFDNQSKDELTTKISTFKSVYDPSAKLLREILSTGIIDQIISNAVAKADASIKATGNKRKVYHAKLYDAHDADKRDGSCTLILTEGDSARGFVMNGIDEIGRDKYGVFPLKGKLLNVRDRSAAAILGPDGNDEIKSIIEIVGLQHNKTYESTKGLRYGSILILTDQDVDGSHIKGLLMNFIHHYWPSLIKIVGFIKCLATPLIKATKKGKKKNPEIVAFYTMRDFEEWEKTVEPNQWDIHYYKGLGTHAAIEGRECFKNINDKVVSYYWQETLTGTSEPKKSKSKKPKVEIIDTDSDLVSTSYKPKYDDICEDAMTLAFAKKRENDRKLWASAYNPNNLIDYKQQRISYYEFINKELVVFSTYDIYRSIPNIMDGFKPGQRKVYFAAVKKNIFNNRIKVAQFTGYVSEQTHYHHGEEPLNMTIVGMAQDYVGSNNLNMFVPDGNFGSRLVGGKDSASPRYIFTKLDKICKNIFIKEDFDVLKHQTEDNDSIEPVFYTPIIPMILVNGSQGIGTGYSTTIHPVNPRDIFANIYRFLDGEKFKPMRPWFRNFRGTVEKITSTRYMCRGNYVIEGDTIHISELPIGTWTDNYKAFIEDLVYGKQDKTKAKAKKEPVKRTAKKAKGKKDTKAMAKNSQTARVAKTNPIGKDIYSYDEDCSAYRVSITLYFNPGTIQKYVENDTLEKYLKLVTPLNLSNMHLFDEEYKIQKYNSYVEILGKFSEIRLEYYQKRKDYLIGKYNKEIDILKWKLKFIKGVINDKIVVVKKKKAEIIEQLESMGFPKIVSGNKKPENTNTETTDPDTETEVDERASYDYLTTMQIIKLSDEEVKKLQNEIKNKTTELKELEAKSQYDLWREELDALVLAYDAWEKESIEKYEIMMNTKNKKGKSTKRKGKKPPRSKSK